MLFFNCNSGLGIIINILMLIISIGFLWKGADFLVESASRIAVKFGISELVIGLTIVAFGTSAPELAVSVTAAINQQADISVGNVVGSNIFNLGFILGTVALVRPVLASPKLIYRDGTFMILISLLLLFFFRDFTLARYEAIILLSLLVAYVSFLLIKKDKIEDEEMSLQEQATWKDGLILFASIAAVVFGGHLLVKSSSCLARAAGISEWTIGVTIVAAGTSAPEMAASIMAVVKGKHGMSAGNLIGSDIFNILGILGIAGIINPLKTDSNVFSSLLMLNGMIVIVLIFLRTGWKLSRLEGAILILIGIIRWLLDFNLFR